MASKPSRSLSLTALPWMSAMVTEGKRDVDHEDAVDGQVDDVGQDTVRADKESRLKARPYGKEKEQKT